jgi:AraC family transcriptional regulator
MPGAHTGKIVSSYAVAGLGLTEAAYPASLAMPRHTHEHAYFSLVLQGEYTECVGQKTRVCSASTVMFHPPDASHSVQFHAASVRIFRVEISPAWLERIRQHSPILESPTAIQGGAPAGLALRLYREFQQRDAVAPLAVEGLTLEILAEASRHAEETPARKPARWLQQARDLLEDRFRESLSLEEIAGSVGVHPVHLARTFHSQYGCTLGDYVRRLRIEFACRQLILSDTPLCAIALAAGFADQSHFSRTLKQKTGLSPGEYRKIYRSH